MGFVRTFFSPVDDWRLTEGLPFDIRLLSAAFPVFMLAAVIGFMGLSAVALATGSVNWLLVSCAAAIVCVAVAALSLVLLLCRCHAQGVELPDEMERR